MMYLILMCLLISPALARRSFQLYNWLTADAYEAAKERGSQYTITKEVKP